LELHRKQSLRATTAPNLSTTPPKSGDPKKPSPSPAHGVATKTTAVSSNKKNGAVVREHAGYDWIEGFEERTLLSAVYETLAPLLNFFMPSQKLKSKIRIGSREVKTCDEPRIPFQRLLERVSPPPACRDTLKSQHALYNPGGTSAECQQGYPAIASAACPGKPYSDTGADIVSVTFPQ
jgi:hypothetical protein